MTSPGPQGDTTSQRPSGAAASDLAIELIGINKHFGPVHANRDIDLADPPRHRPRHRRRKRRRQIDADVDPLRLLHRRLAARSASTASPTTSPTAAMRSRSASAWSTSTSCWSTISPSSRTSFSAPRIQRAARPQPRRAPAGELEAPRQRVQPRRRSRCDHRGRLGRPAAARRNPQGALPRRRCAHPRRADGRADAGRGRRPLPRAPRRCASRARPSSSSPTSCARSWPSPTTCR